MCHIATAHPVAIRRWSGRTTGAFPRRGDFNRRHLDADVPRYRLGRRARAQYRRLVDVLGPTGSAFVVLSILLDLAGDALGDVTITQAQLTDRWLARRRAERAREGAGTQWPTPLEWGLGVASVRRAVRSLERQGWVSLQDVPVPGGGARHMLSYRLHIPVDMGTQTAWLYILSNTEARRRRSVSGPRTRADQALGDRPVVPPPTAAEAERVADLDPLPAVELTGAEALAQARRHPRLGGRGHDPP